MKSFDVVVDCAGACFNVKGLVSKNGDLDIQHVDVLSDLVNVKLFEAFFKDEILEAIEQDEIGFELGLVDDKNDEKKLEGL